VKCLYRRDRANMPGSQREVAECRGGGRRVRLAVRALVKMRLGQPDASGRRAPEPEPGSEFTLEADLVIKALGYDPEDLPKLFGAEDLSVTRWGTLRVDHKSMMTSVDGVFAAGDIVRGASLVVWAIRDGRDVTEHMHRYLKAKARSGAQVRERELA
jgi:glutamate synthase (NADPH/NADH) small chain